MALSRPFTFSKQFTSHKITTGVILTTAKDYGKAVLTIYIAAAKDVLPILHC